MVKSVLWFESFSILLLPHPELLFLSLKSNIKRICKTHIGWTRRDVELDTFKISLSENKNHKVIWIEFYLLPKAKMPFLKIASNACAIPRHIKVYVEIAYQLFYNRYKLLLFSKSVICVL